MLVTFSTKSYSDIMMFDDIAKRLLTMMGHSATIPGAIVAADVGAALARLKSALQVEDSVKPAAAAAAADEPNDTLVSLRHRAWPLVELLDNAIKRNADVMWK